VSELGLGISVEAPNVDSIFLTAADHQVVIAWAEHDGFKRVGVTYEGLEIERHILFSFVVPYFDHAVFPSSDHIATVV
jgi:hypothetical protein